METGWLLLGLIVGGVVGLFLGYMLARLVRGRGDRMIREEMREFLGTLRSGDSGLFVSTGDFTNDAKVAAEHSAEPVTLLDRDDFIRLLLEHYEALDPEFKAKVPLRKVWVPAE